MFPSGLVFPSGERHTDLEETIGAECQICWWVGKKELNSTSLNTWVLWDQRLGLGFGFGMVKSDLLVSG